MFHRVIALFCLLSLAVARRENEFTINYKANDELSNTTVSYDRDELTIRTYTPAGDHFVQVDSLEDYNVEDYNMVRLEDHNVGFSATRMDADEVCYIAKLSTTFKKQLALYRSHKDDPIVITQSEELKAIPAEDTEEYGDRLNEFCGDYPVYKLGTYDNGLEAGAIARQVSYTFYNCYVIRCAYTCYYTTVTVPTGTNIMFVWFFG
ncbi:BRICHOS domain [Trinorchestia longiramus]|nr:BRICHOS domain [Trinorchestia longiramus]